MTSDDELVQKLAEKYRKHLPTSFDEYKAWGKAANEVEETREMSGAKKISYFLLVKSYLEKNPAAEQSENKLSARLKKYEGKTFVDLSQPHESEDESKVQEFQLEMQNEIPSPGSDTKEVQVEPQADLHTGSLLDPNMQFTDKKTIRKNLENGFMQNKLR